MSVSTFEHIFMQGPIMLHMAPHLTLIDICRLTRINKLMRFTWPVKYNACLSVLQKALAHFGWPCLPPLSDQVRRTSCEYNVFCNMMESKCRIANLDLEKHPVLFCVGEGCGNTSTSRHFFGGQVFTKFTRCTKCCQVEGRYDKHLLSFLASEKHWVAMYKLFGDQFTRKTTSGMVLKRFYNENLIQNHLVDKCLKSGCCPVVSADYIKKQVAVHAEEFSKILFEKYKRKKL
jgi:hypothetical protein